MSKRTALQVLIERDRFIFDRLVRLAELVFANNDPGFAAAIEKEDTLELVTWLTEYLEFAKHITDETFASFATEGRGQELVEAIVAAAKKEGGKQ